MLVKKTWFKKKGRWDTEPTWRYDGWFFLGFPIYVVRQSLKVTY